MYKAKKGFMFFHLFIDKGMEFKKSEQSDYEDTKTAIRLPTVFIENCPDIFNKIAGDGSIIGEPVIEIDKPDKEIEDKPKIKVIALSNEKTILLLSDLNYSERKGMARKLQIALNYLLNQ